MTRARPRPLLDPRRSPPALAFLALAALWLLLGGGGAGAWERREILYAIRMVESGGRDDVRDGDGGRAIGPYQIHEIYWRDALAQAPELGGSYQDCRHRAYAEAVLAAYMTKYAPAAWARGDAETISRVHNGGPLGPQKAATRGYWLRVRSYLP